VESDRRAKCQAINRATEELSSNNELFKSVRIHSGEEKPRAQAREAGVIEPIVVTQDADMFVNQSLLLCYLVFSLPNYRRRRRNYYLKMLSLEMALSE